MLQTSLPAVLQATRLLNGMRGGCPEFMQGRSSTPEEKGREE